MAEFNYHKFMLEKWGDPDRLTAFLHGYGEKDVQRATVNMWFRRQSIPGAMFAKLVALLKIEYGDVNVEEYLE